MASENINISNFTNSPKSGRSIDQMRQENSAYEYLCHLEEARIWMQDCLNEELPAIQEFETRLRNGVYFAKLGNYIAPHIVPLKKIFDIDQQIYNKSGLHYRHTDNVNHWILAIRAIGLPSYFYPNSFDVYGKKNMPKAIYCVHALSLYLYNFGQGIKILNLMGKIKFSREEINAVRTEFKEYGIQLPAFNKISGMLASMVSPTQASLHAAILAINIAISSQNSEELYSNLMNPNASLINVFKEHAIDYLSAMYESKLKMNDKLKVKANLSCVPGKCANFLTQKVIQEIIDTVNLQVIFRQLKDAASTDNIQQFANILQHPLIGLKNVIPSNNDAYLKKFKEFIPLNFSQSDFQALILSVNKNKSQINEVKAFLIKLNTALECTNCFNTLNILKFQMSKFINLHEFGAEFYHFNLVKLKKEKGDLGHSDVENAVVKLTAFLDIAASRNEEDTFKAISNPVIKTWLLYPECKRQYFNIFAEILQGKESYVKYLSSEQIQLCINKVNKNYEIFKSLNNYNEKIDFAVSTNFEELFLQSLLNDTNLSCVYLKNKMLYLQILLDHKTRIECNELSYEKIQCQINYANELAMDAENKCKILTIIDASVEKKDSETLFKNLQMFSDLCRYLCKNSKDVYLKQLSEMKERKNLSKNECCCDWFKYEVSPSMIFYKNYVSLETGWNMNKIKVYTLSKNEIENCIMNIRCENSCFTCNIDTFITSLQAYIRGYLIRQWSLKHFNDKNSHLRKKAALKIQSFMRKSIIRRKYLQHKSNHMKKMRAAKLIQRCWRSFKIKENLQLLTHSSNPPLCLIQNIIYMLEISNDDYSEEFRLHNVKGKLVQTIRYNQDLSKELDAMDIKIGLLIRNCFTLKELVLQKKQINSKIEVSNRDQSKKLNFFSKRYKSLIETFENLLYLLQTVPHYLSKLIVILPSNQASVLIESLLFSLFNYGSTPREEYLLLNLLYTALDEEIKVKVDRFQDIIKDDHLVLKMIISLYRKGYQQDSLKDLLLCPIAQVLEDNFSVHGTNPIDIYKIWQNEIEIETGKKSQLPYDVTVEESLCHQEVNHRFNMFLDNLLKHSLHFCECIVNSQNVLPYGMKYIAKVLKHFLKKKYPYASSEDLYKLIGNFLYYRYINPAITAPDSYGILNIKPSEILHDDDRLKLSCIANFLQFAATGKTYSEDMSHMMSLNPYLKDCYRKFLLFFEDVCKVPDLKEQFDISEFSEAVLPTPEVYLKLKELKNLHKLLTETEYVLAPDSNDILHELLEEFDSETLSEIFDGEDEEILMTELCLSLKSRNNLEIENDEEKIYVETKFMLITLLQVLPSLEDITEVLNFEPSSEEESKFETVCCSNQNESNFSHNSHKFKEWKNFTSFQQALQYNLNVLELAGYVSIKNNYQDILNDIAKDIVNRWKYRISCKEEILKLMEIQKLLDVKTLYYLEKLDSYNKYIAACLENLKPGDKSTIRKVFQHRFILDNNLKNKVVKYSGSKLHEKGILLEIKDLDRSQFKNVLFEISSSEEAGMFIIKTKFMGMGLETVDIDIQDLLCLKYQGRAVMTLFECVTINNNLFLHFLNKSSTKNISHVQKILVT